MKFIVDRLWDCKSSIQTASKPGSFNVIILWMGGVGRWADRQKDRQTDQSICNGGWGSW